MTVSKPSVSAREYAIGTPLPGQEHIPTLFKPLEIRNVTLRNRIAVSPMCTYSGHDGHATDFHLVHDGQFALHGASIVMVEATNVQARGRISPYCLGLWKDSQIEPLAKIASFVRSQGAVAAIQLGHAGRKASTQTPFNVMLESTTKNVATEDEGGWPDDLLAPSAIPWSDGFPTPKAATQEDINQFIEDFKAAAKRAVTAGFQIIEIHAAHGYFLFQFLSPTTNKRTDKYGGSFENRTRLLRDTIRAVRSVIPSEMPLFLRISSTEWLEHTGQPSWTPADTISVALEIATEGLVDLIDVSSGGNSPDQQIPRHQKLYQVQIAGDVRAALRAAGHSMLVGAVGLIDGASMAQALVQGADGENDKAIKIAAEYASDEPRADLVFVARQFLRDPTFVKTVAQELGIQTQLAKQYERAAVQSKH
ncbi:hypothetical protein TD95_003552 [Thielaviopsis punctulata]|uniref:NADH:flavin oxidoreductase/NADH oxidase N-terminal domain-containing protein n=1 Tax=Thielaviopsis punctulata TaxID=72032 RepID=A0A0F4ZHD7_9PEZI|nr:hypothetical protein TD95_003552 [Thielaviopsis punctulata]